MIFTIPDQYCGNILKVKNYLESLGAIYSPPDICNLDELKIVVFCGVGHWDSGMALKDIKIGGTLYASPRDLLKDGYKILAICLGFQLFGQASDESRDALPGYCLFNFRTCRLSGSLQNNTPQIHMGFNTVQTFSSEKKSENKFEAYFSHGYYVPFETKTVFVDQLESYGVTMYNNQSIVAYLQTNNFLGIQFHPEVSRGSFDLTIKKFIISC